MYAYLLCCQPRVWIDIEDPSEKVSHFFIADVAGNRREFATLNLAEQICLKLTKEGQLADKDYIENDTTGPNIRSLTVVRLFSGQIRVHIVRCATKHVEFVIGSRLETEAEVDNLDVLAGRVHQNVVQFEVSVRVPLGMHV